MKPKQKETFKNELSEIQFKALIENAHEGIVLYDTKGRIKYASKSVTKICGYKEADILGKGGADFLHPEDAAMARKTFFELLQRPGKSVTLFHRTRKKKGVYIWVESRLTNFSHVPEINGIVSNFRDITERKQAEEQAQKTRNLLETVSRNLTEGIFMGVLGTEFIYVNEAFLKITGYKTFKEIQKIKPGDLYADELHQKSINKDLGKKHALKDVKTLFRKKNGDTFWVVMNVSLLTYEGKSNYFVGTIRDISREKEAEQQLIESRNFLDNIINTVAAPIFVKDSLHRWVMFNQKFTELVARGRLTGKTDKDFFPEEETRVFWKIDDQVLRTGKTVVNEEKLTTRKGSVHDLLTVKSRYINEKNEKFVIGFITNITHLKKTEEKIKQLHADLKGVLESSEESIFAVDNHLCYTAFNRHHKKIMKELYEADIEIGAHKINYLKKSDDVKWVKAELQKALLGNHFVTEHYQDFQTYKGHIQITYNPIRDEKNKIKGVAVFIQDITDRKRFEQIIKSINANLRAVMESTSDRILAIDRNYKYIIFNRAHAQNFLKLYGQEIKVGDHFPDILPSDLSVIFKREIEKAFNGKQFTVETAFPGNVILETSYNPIYDEKGGVTGAALFIRDTTERNQMEERLKTLNGELTEQNGQLAAQEEELKTALEELSERNFELDQLMYKTSHDLRSPLSSIMGLINLAHLDPDPANNKEYLSKIEGRIKKLDEFIRSMLDYARVNRVEIEPENIELEKMVRGCIKELEYLDNFKEVKTDIKIKNVNGLFRSDRLRLQIIFGNIISNAYKYYNPEADSFLKIRVQRYKHSIKILFEDNGIGIRQEHLDKIFNMFYRATDRSQGSGLGMYIVKQAVEKLKGNISIESEYGRGTQIRIELPNG